MERLPEGTKVCVNVSTADLLDADTRSALVSRVVREMNPHRVGVEVVETEDADLWGNPAVEDVLDRLTSAGVELAVDDFGTGYSNLERIVVLPVETLKVDGSLVKRLGTDAKIDKLVKSIVSFAHDVGMRVVAEFVSSDDLVKHCRELGVDYLQGYRVSPPLPLEVAVAFAKKWLAESRNRVR